MYVKFPGGWRNPGGYVVPCEVVSQVNDTRGGLVGAYVRLTAEDGSVSWSQYVRKEQLLNDDEVENDQI